MEQAKFSFSLLKKIIKNTEKQLKINEKTSWSLTSFKIWYSKLTIKNKIPEDRLSERVKNKMQRINETETMVNGENLFLEGKKRYIWFMKIWHNKIISRNIFIGKITLHNAVEDQVE